MVVIWTSLNLCLAPRQKLLLGKRTHEKSRRHGKVCPWSVWILDIKQKITRIQSITTEKIYNKEEPKEIHMDSS